jgi:hypothetical protein
MGLDLRVASLTGAAMPSGCNEGALNTKGPVAAADDRKAARDWPAPRAVRTSTDMGSRASRNALPTTAMDDRDNGHVGSEGQCGNGKAQGQN